MVCFFLSVGVSFARTGFSKLCAIMFQLSQPRRLYQYFRSLRILEPSGDGGDDRYRIAFLGGSILFLQIANILVIYVHIDESAQLAVIGVEMAAQVAILCCEIGQGFSDGAALNVNRRVFAGILPEWGGNMNLHDRALIITRMRSASPRIQRITTD